MDKHDELVKVLKERKDKQKAIKGKFADLEKVKKLTTDQRLSRIEEYLGIS